MAETFMDLGGFIFSIDSVTYQALKHDQSYRWSTVNRIGRRPSKQFTGVGVETMEFAGISYPTNPQQLHALSQLSDLAVNGEPFLLVDGIGFDWGMWVVLSISEGHTVFNSLGVARKKSFSIKLENYGEDEI